MGTDARCICAGYPMITLSTPRFRSRASGAPRGPRPPIFHAAVSYDQLARTGARHCKLIIPEEDFSRAS